MNARHLTVALLSAAMLAGCADAGPLAPTDSLLGTKIHDYDRLPPLPDIDPPKPLPPVEDPVMPEPPVEAAGALAASQALDPVFPMPPIEDPVKPLPPVEDPVMPEPPAEDPVKPLPPAEDPGASNDARRNTR